MLFVGEIPIRFNRHTDRVYIDWNWINGAVLSGDYIVLEGWAALDPQSYTDVYNDRMLKTYLTALLKQQWGANLSKYQNIQLPGGVVMNGQQIYIDGTNDVKMTEQQIKEEYQLPVMFLVG